MTLEIAAKVFSGIASLALVSWGCYRKFWADKNASQTDVVTLSLSSVEDARSRFKIAVIDDDFRERFPESERSTLLQRGFSIDYLPDIYRVSDLNKYQIVLCDIMGVGQHLGIRDEKHGGIIVSELRRTRPMIYIIIYSSRTYDPDFNQYFGLADIVVSLARLNAELIPALDSAMQTLASPASQWERLNKWVIGKRADSIKPRAMKKLHKAFLKHFGAAGSALDNQLSNMGLDMGGPKGEGASLDLAKHAADFAEELTGLLR